MMSKTNVYALAISFSTFFIALSFGQTPSLEVEVAALNAFKNSVTDDPFGALVDWTDANHICNWSGIICDPSSNHVINISLVGMHLKGEISPFLGNLSKLQVLDLTLNSFTGNVPAKLGHCTELVQLILYRNFLSGEIPAELGNLKNLQLLDFGNNSLSGRIPESICNCTELLFVSLINNSLTGKLPSEIGNLANLQLLEAYRNNLVGSIPTSIGMLTALQTLDLSSNQFTGPIPPEIGNLSSLEILQLHHNFLSGKIPSELGLCINLVTLDMYNNQFTGGVPPELGNLENLHRLRLYNNKLNSSIPASLFHLKSLTHLGLSHNEQTGKIPPEFGSLMSLQVLTLHSNRLYGEIPSTLTNLANLTYLSLSFNLFTGSLPSELGLLYNLKNLTASDNLLEGPIPSSITNCSHLRVLTLTFNRITGKIPNGLGKLSNLTFLSLGSNKMRGEIPDDLFNCSMLEVLDLSGNNFSGKLKPMIGGLSKLRVLRAHSNSFLGPIPPEIGKLSQLIDLVLHKNSFSGVISPEVSKLSNLQGLSLSDNKLEGELPVQLFELTRLYELLLQNNNFFGPIPNQISKLESLSLLDLSGNKLNGTIPESMESLHRLMTLDISHNLLTGTFPRVVLASMRSMQFYLNFSSNLLDGEIPFEIGMLEMVQGIDMSNNNLSGNIPRSLGRCKNLFSLDLSGNMLSGPAPGEILTKLSELVFLNLSRNRLEGKLPEMVGLLHLRSLDLSQNKFKGIIPERFANMPALIYLNLSFNQLEGHIPKGGVFDNLRSADLQGNPSLCGTEFLSPCSIKRNQTSSHGLSKKTWIILGPVLVLILHVVGIFLCHLYMKKQKVKDSEDIIPNYTSALSLQRFYQKDLEHATDNFSPQNIIGASSSSNVYKGTLEGEKIVAVKKLNLQFSAEIHKCFDREVKTLSQLKHRNLVKVLGYAWESKKLMAVILEYMENGNLDSFIYGQMADDWTLSNRIDILVSVASGLSYLHSGYDFPIVHCDLKPSNILLDKNMEAHVSDFGTARMLGIHHQDGSSISSASAFEGTIGYMAPGNNYYNITSVNHNTQLSRFSFPMTLNQIVQNALANGINNLVQIVDPNLASHVSENQEVVEGLLNLALYCTYPDPDDRPHLLVDHYARTHQWQRETQSFQHLHKPLHFFFTFWTLNPNNVSIKCIITAKIHFHPFGSFPFTLRKPNSCIISSISSTPLPPASTIPTLSWASEEFERN